MRLCLSLFSLISLSPPSALPVPARSLSKISFFLFPCHFSMFLSFLPSPLTPLTSYCSVFSSLATLVSLSFSLPSFLFSLSLSVYFFFSLSVSFFYVLVLSPFPSHSSHFLMFLFLHSRYLVSLSFSLSSFLFSLSFSVYSS